MKDSRAGAAGRTDRGHFGVGWSHAWTSGAAQRSHSSSALCAPSQTPVAGGSGLLAWDPCVRGRSSRAAAGHLQAAISRSSSVTLCCVIWPAV